MTWLRAVHPAGWFGVAVLACLVFLAVHRYERDPGDSDWMMAGELAPPANVGLVVIDADAPFRERSSRPATLTGDPRSSVGEW